MSSGGWKVSQSKFRITMTAPIDVVMRRARRGEKLSPIKDLMDLLRRMVNAKMLPTDRRPNREEEVWSELELGHYGAKLWLILLSDTRFL